MHKARFTWTSSGGRLNYDTHSDRQGVSYHGYGKSSSQSETGELMAAFTGNHGWFWRNRTGAPVTVTLKTEGAYTETGELAASPPGPRPTPATLVDHFRGACVVFIRPWSCT